MNTKEEKQVLKIMYALDILYELVGNMDEVCVEKDRIIFAHVNKILRYKNKIIKRLDVIQKNVDKLLNLA